MSQQDSRHRRRNKSLTTVADKFVELLHEEPESFEAGSNGQSRSMKEHTAVHALEGTS